MRVTSNILLILTTPASTIYCYECYYYYDDRHYRCLYIINTSLIIIFLFAFIAATGRIIS